MKKLRTLLFFITAGAAIHLSFLPADVIKTKAALGKQLFSEKTLSKDSSISCASCHIPEFGFADTVAFSKGVYGKLTKRNTPSVLNMKNRPYFFWDARAATLQQQALIPIANPDEMGLPIKEAVKRLNANPYYKKLFVKVFGAVPNPQNLSEAFAAFESTLETGESKFDLSVDDKVQLTPQEEKGRQLFIGNKAHCFDCHSGEDFTNDDFKNIGLYDGYEPADRGRFNITKDSNDLGKFKTPGLRNVAITAPYMHDGRLKTLEEVVEFYNSTTHFVSNPINIDKALAVPLRLSKQDKENLVVFLKTLTDKRYQK